MQIFLAYIKKKQYLCSRKGFLKKDSMKKYLIIGLLAVMVLVMTSCSTCDCKHEPTIPCQFNKKTIDLTVYQKEWTFDNDTKQFYAHFDLPELTSDIYNYGNYSLHREYNTGLSTAYQVALPQSLLLSETVTQGSGTSVVYYTQLVDYRVGVGYVEVQVTNSDFYYPTNTQGNLIKPESMVFHLQLIY
jgi:hypothetical protein